MIKYIFDLEMWVKFIYERNRVEYVSEEFAQYGEIL